MGRQRERFGAVVGVMCGASWDLISGAAMLLRNPIERAGEASGAFRLQDDGLGTGFRANFS